MKRRFLAVAIAAAAIQASAAIVVSCRGAEASVNPEIILSRNNADNTSDSQFIEVRADGSWTMEIMFEDKAESWARLKNPVGSGDDINTLYWDANPYDAPRGATITLTCGKKSASVEFFQNGKGPVSSGGLHSDTVPPYMELPAVDDTTKSFYTRDMVLGTKRIRNYSNLLDPDARISVWVAYPLNRYLMGDSNVRPSPDPWTNDPKVPLQYQANVSDHAFSGYQRGHQLPSRDRCASLSHNLTTFYGVNVTPQLGSLNTGGWETLEGRVREWSKSFDTLYVVTGADIKGGYRVVNDNAGKPIAIPNGYFKALLGYKRGATSSQFPGQVGGYIGIGFYYEHRAYKTTFMSQSMTIDELEDITGFDFFVNLPDDKETQIEKTQSTWWK